MVKSHFEVKTDYRELAIVVHRHATEGYQLQSAYCNPHNLKEIVCTFSQVANQAAAKKLKAKKVARKEASKKVKHK